MTAISTESLYYTALLRQHLATFVARCFDVLNPGRPFEPNWHIEAIAHELERVRNGETKRLLITMPPRSLKSLCASVAFPAFLLGHDPTRQIVCVSYASDLATQHARDCRAVMDSDWYRILFPGTRISPTKRKVTDFATTQRGGRIATTVGGTLTGRGGSLIVIDDPQKPTDAMSEPRRRFTLDWYRNTLTTRLNDKRNDAIICVIQPLHVDDLAAHLIETGEWTHLNLPAIAPQDQMIDLGVAWGDDGPRHSRLDWKEGDLLHPTFLTQAVLDREKANMSLVNFAAQYLQSPIPEEGNLVKWEWFGFYDELPKAGKRARIVQSWDFAVQEGEKNSWSVCITARVEGNAIHILDVFRERINYPSQRDAYIAQARKHRANVCLVEKAANGRPLIEDLKRIQELAVPTPEPVTVKGSKPQRFEIGSARIRNGDVLLPRRAPWLEEFRTELVSFPDGKHDDQADALSQLINWTEGQRYRETVPTRGAIIVYGS